jgi:hypothetical protein
MHADGLIVRIIALAAAVNAAEAWATRRMLEDVMGVRGLDADEQAALEGVIEDLTRQLEETIDAAIAAGLYS